jgi:MSHA biogenesis protein MshQ
MKVTVTAYNKGNGVTQNYAGADARDVTFSALDAAGTALTGNGRFSRSATYPAGDTAGTAQLRANDFVAGVGTWTGSYTFTMSPTAPTRVRVRATDTDTVNSASAAEPTFMLRSGRVHVANAYGNATGLLRIPVNIEFYTGQTWVRNFEDTTTTFGQSAVSLGRTANPVAIALTPFANGAATLGLTPAAGSPRASVPFAINLGTTTGANTSCYYVAAAGTTPSSMTDSTGAGLPFLRSADRSCGKTNIDPSAMATFGIFAPETKRIIHMREVYR